VLWPFALYMDVHVHAAITEQLRRRGVDVLTAQEDGSDQLADDELLKRSSSLNRVMFTNDVRFQALAEIGNDWARSSQGLSMLIPCGAPSGNA
jgi:predicted nuclease of predicted toxin-antitoxin system